MTKYIEKERAKYWPVFMKLMAQHRDGLDKFEWRQNGLLHRDGDLPAIIYPIGGWAEWWQNGKIHRDGDKPALINVDSMLEWYQTDQLHRICGPAVIRVDGKLEWWINGEDITQEVKKWLAGTEWRGTPEQIVEFQLRFT